VIVDGSSRAPPLLRRGRFDVAFITDHFQDALPIRARCGAPRPTCCGAPSSRLAPALLRRRAGYLASPELRVWSRRYFRYTGPISGSRA
jgi:hypothetical protein